MDCELVKLLDEVDHCLDQHRLTSLDSWCTNTQVNKAVTTCCVLFCTVLLGAMHAVTDLEEVLQEC